MESKVIKEYLLDSAKAFLFFKENLSQVNELSTAIFEVLKLKSGTFHTFLPENMSFEKIHDFKTGGKTTCLKKEISVRLTNIINSDTSFSCIFDDFNSDIDNVDQNDLYQLCGVHYQREIYYQINSGISQDLVLKCLNYSSTIWHSLCVVFKNELECRKEINQSYIQMISKNALFIMIEAYDSESYICWSCTEDYVRLLREERL
jgi:hypothetical protein